MARAVKKISAKKDQKIEDLLGLVDLGKVEQVKQASGIFMSVYDVLRKYKGFTKVVWRDQVDDYFKKCYSNGKVAIDTETDNSVDPRTAIMVGLCLFTPYSYPVYIPVNHYDKVTGLRVKNQITNEELTPYLEKLKNCFCIYHNAKFDVNVIDTNCNVRLPVNWETFVTAKLLDENRIGHAPYSLKTLYRDLLEPAQPVYNIGNLFHENKTAEVNAFALYSAMDPYDTYKLYERQYEELQAPSMQRLYKLATEIEFKITEISAQMEQEGANFDVALAKKYLIKFQRLTQEKQDEINKFFEPLRYKKGLKLAEWPINVSSSDQVVTALNEMGISCEDSQEPTLKALKEIYPICGTILECRSANHMVTSFFKPYIECVNKKTGRIHASFDQLGGEDKSIKTGRFSCKSPNLQQLPAFDDSVRLCFRGDDGNCIIGSDYSAQEPRITASVTNEDALISGYNLRNEEFPRGKDYYSQLASAAFNKPYWECTEFRKPVKVEKFLSVIPDSYYVTLSNGNTEQVKRVEIGQTLKGENDIDILIESKESTSEGLKFNSGKNLIKAYYYEQGEFNAEGKALRAKAKGVQLGIVYGMGSARLAKQIGVEFDEGERILNDFFSSYKNVAAWREFNVKKMQTYGFMETLKGRRRRLPDIFLNPVDVKIYDIEKVDNIFPNIYGDSIKVLNKEESDRQSKIVSSMNFKKKESQKEVLKQAGFEVRDNGGFISRVNTQCTNSVIQGSAADMTKLAMIEIVNSPILKKYGAKLRFLVHDEILIEAPIEHRIEVEREFVDCMIRAPKDFCQVAMICDAELETRWKEGHTIGNILKCYNSEGIEAVYNKYEEFDKNDLDKIVKGEFDPETEIIRVR